MVQNRFLRNHYIPQRVHNKLLFTSFETVYETYLAFDNITTVLNKLIKLRDKDMKTLFQSF